MSSISSSEKWAEVQESVAGFGGLNSQPIMDQGQGFLSDSAWLHPDVTVGPSPSTWARPTHPLPPRSASWSWRLKLKCCERKILLGWLELELELVAGVVWEEITVALEESRSAEHSAWWQDELQLLSGRQTILSTPWPSFIISHFNFSKFIIFCYIFIYILYLGA